MAEENQIRAQENMYSRMGEKLGANSPKNKMALMLLRRLGKQQQSAESGMLREQAYQQGENITAKQLESSRQREQVARSKYNIVAQVTERLDKGTSIPKSLFKAPELRGGGGGLSGLAAAMQRYNELF